MLETFKFFSEAAKISREMYGVKKIPPGWEQATVVEGKISRNIRQEVRVLVPKREFSLAAKRARDEMQKLQNQFGRDDLAMLLVPDKERTFGFSMNPVFPEDLTRENPQELILELVNAVGKDNQLFAMKRAAYMAITGYTSAQ